MQTTSHSLAETNAFAAAFVKELVGDLSQKSLQKKMRKAEVVALSGDLGSGKTAFVKAVAGEFGIKDDVTSPTFIIEKIYELADSPFQRLIHIDAYRLESGAELLHLGWADLIADPRNIIFIEWPEKVADIMHFQFIDENTREIRYEKN
jgi:tRNA threonylcarbamoyladenosine biosynthesis protein TsaE